MVWKNVVETDRQTGHSYTTHALCRLDI